MILDGGACQVSELDRSADIFIYGLGYERRSSFLARHISCTIRVALQLPATDIFSYASNVAEAKRNGHIIIEDYRTNLSTFLSEMLRARREVTLVLDISSMTRTMIFEVMVVLAISLRNEDRFRVVYAPSRYSVPELAFPQIEKVGPLGPMFSAFKDDSSKPIGLILGTGFETGITVGIITQLEPRVGYCLWGGGVDKRFDLAVRKANFDFEFNGYNVVPVRYDISDPGGFYRILENLSYGLSLEHNVIFVLLGPKLFSFGCCLVALNTLGKSSVWRVQHSAATARDALPGRTIVFAEIDTGMFIRARSRIEEVIGKYDAW